MKLFAKSCTDYEKNMYLCTRKLKSGCSAVGIALRSGRRGRAFESPHPDSYIQKEKKLDEYPPASSLCFFLSLKLD